jgi:hypothetical protein
MMRYFCTYFDHRYLARGLAMYRSLKRHCPSARLWVLCLTDECYRVLRRLSWSDIVPVKLDDFEHGDLRLQAAKASRSLIEYYFTCSPSLPLFILKQNPEVDLITYLDSDLYFFSDPEPIYQEMANHSIAIIAHRFSDENKWMERNGVYNVGWLSFRRDDEGLACLRWWRERCLEWCHDYVEHDRFADQKYLNRFPELFRNVKVIQHKGANLATWNLSNYKLSAHSDTLTVDDQPVLFFHFQGIRKIGPGVIDPCVQFYNLRVSWMTEWKLFRPYFRKLREASKIMASELGPSNSLFGLPREASNDGAKVRPLEQRFGASLKHLLTLYRGVLARRFLLSFD